MRQRIRTVLGFVESCDTHVTVTAAWWTPVIHHALDAWFRHTARVTLVMDTAFVTLAMDTACVTDVLHCLCYERVTLLVWQTCYAACAVLRTLMWCSRTCGPCNSLMPFSWSQNSTENTKPNTNTKASYIEDILMQWSWKPFSIKYHTLQLSDVLVLAVTWWSETNRLVIKSWTLRAAALVFRIEVFLVFLVF